MVGDYELSERIITSHDDMRAVLALRIETDFGESLDAVSAREPGQLTQTATSSALKLSSGTGKIAEVSAQLGFSAQSNFTRFFQQQVGIPPSEYRRAVVKPNTDPQG